jgi:hypothetical protein
MSHTRKTMGQIKKNLWRGLVAGQQTYLIREEILNEEEVDKDKVIFKTCKF